MTLPDEKETFVHRIGRVGRADRMGLAISLCAAVKEKVSFVLLLMAHSDRYGTTSALAKGKSATIPGSSRMAGAPSGTMSLRYGRLLCLD